MFGESSWLDASLTTASKPTDHPGRLNALLRTSSSENPHQLRAVHSTLNRVDIDDDATPAKQRAP